MTSISKSKGAKVSLRLKAPEGGMGSDDAGNSVMIAAI
jgi:hypothetical protein